MVLSTRCPHIVVFWQSFAGQKVKVPAIPWGWGPWLQMTGALEKHIFFPRWIQYEADYLYSLQYHKSAYNQRPTYLAYKYISDQIILLATMDQFPKLNQLLGIFSVVKLHQLSVTKASQQS